MAETKTKHTPGPWRYFKQGDGTRFHVTARPPTKPGNNWDDFATVDVSHEADARLIAAAPEMLEALRILDVAIDSAAATMALDDAAVLRSTQSIARAAIARAEGR